MIASCDIEDLMYTHTKSYLSALFASFSAVFDQNASTLNSLPQTTSVKICWSDIEDKMYSHAELRFVYSFLIFMTKMCR